jgi:predicted amidohydrolase
MRRQREKLVKYRRTASGGRHKAIMNKLRVAAVALRSEFGQTKQNLRSILHWMERASENGAHLVCFPETALQGYCTISALIEKLAEPISGPSCTQLHEKARELGITISVGMAFRERGKLYNSQVYIGPSGFIGAQHKVHLCGIDQVYEPGDTWNLVQVGDWNVGTTICFDAEFPEASRILALKGADVVVMSFASGRRNCLGEPAQPADWRPEVMSWAPARAYDNRIFVVGVNHAGEVNDPHGFAVANPAKLLDVEEWAPPGSLHRWPGYNFAVGPTGKVIAESDSVRNAENMLVMDLDPTLLRRARKRLRLKLHNGQREGDVLAIRRVETFSEILMPSC